MATFSKQLLSGSTNGKGIKIAATATAGTAIHTATAGTSNLDEVWLWAWNSDTVERLLTIEFGGVTDPDNLVEIPIPPSSSDDPKLVIPGWLLQNGLAIAGFAAATNVVVVYGYVNRITA